MAPPAGDKKADKSYLSTAVDSINPWAGSRSVTPTPKDPQPAPSVTNPGDHSTSHLYGQSFKRYPLDCPPLKVQWFHAVDIPKRKPKFLRAKNIPDDDKLPPQPKKFVAFSPKDSSSIETAYQKVLEELEEQRTVPPARKNPLGGTKRRREVSGGSGLPNDNLEQRSGGITVPVNEDFLFDVDIEQRELAPVYWLGPVYEVRRGSWFYQEGSTLRPCEENLAAQLEEGYLKVRPWAYPVAPKIRSDSGAKDVTPKASTENLKVSAASQVDVVSKSLPAASAHQPQTYRLFGTYMNNVATYQDSTTAWLSSDGVFSWVTSTVYERFAGGAYMSGVKLVRGFSEAKKAKEEKRPSTPTGTKSSTANEDEKEKKLLKRRSAPPSTKPTKADESGTEGEVPGFESRGSRLTRQLSSLIEKSENRDPEAEEEEIRKREEKEIQDDYNARIGETQGRDIEHLVLVTHGIGQLLGLRMESVNFVHDVNVMRKTLKQVYSTSADLRALNSEPRNDGLGNCKIQVLPVCWRHLLDFPKRRERKNTEHDLSETYDEESEYPSLEDITIEGMAFARSLISDLALDVLLYQSGYREQIVEIVLRESNRIYKLFLERNPEFNGKVHVMGHSLGSAIMFDILCRQKEKPRHAELTRNPLRFWPSQEVPEPPKDPRELSFDFDVEDFYCLGSPVGLFQMLKGRTVSARHLPNALPSESPLNPEYIDDPFLSVSSGASVDQRVSPITGLPFTVSSPKASQLFNIFHPSDPIAYRLEPLISPAMSSLKPQALPYTKKGIFSAVSGPQGLTGIGAKVGQSVSGLWSSLSAGIASSLLNRSLGLSHEDIAAINAASSQPQHPLSPAAGTNISAGGVISPEATASAKAEKAAERMLQLADETGRTSLSGNDATLIDDELETLFSRFQKNRADMAGSDGDGDGKKKVAPDRKRWLEEDEKAQRLRREEMKVRALNRNGRVDYGIQESVLDFNPINTIASHMSYWADEDVNHFIMSQLLSNKSRAKK